VHAASVVSTPDPEHRISLETGPFDTTPLPFIDRHTEEVAAPPQAVWRLLLEGSHRFSRYELHFNIEEAQNGASLLAAETRAEFPGLAGTLYEAAVIGTRGHVIVVKRLLGLVARRATP
jgi:hypothetical protein